LQFYQLSLTAPRAPDSIYNKEAARRGMLVFNGKQNAQAVTFRLSLPNRDGTHTKQKILALMIFRQTDPLIAAMLHKA
jgi:hypothetical protein